MAIFGQRRVLIAALTMLNAMASAAIRTGLRAFPVEGQVSPD